MKKVLVLTGSDSKMYEVLDLTIKSKKNYSKEHNYDLIIKRDFKHEMDKYKLGIGFARVICAFNYLNEYDTVMWVDADSIITNNKYPIEYFINDKQCFYASYDWHANSVGKSALNKFSSGNFIIVKTPNTKKFFNEFMKLSQNPKFKIDSLAEQGVLNYMKENNIMSDDICILEHKFLNSVPKFMIISNIWVKRIEMLEGIWDENCFLAHLTGCNNSDRIKILNNSELKKYI